MGVYASWGRVGANAESAGRQLDSYFRQMLTVLRQHAVNTIWITNLPADKLPYVAEVADEIGIDLFVNVAQLEARLNGRDAAYFDLVVPPIVESVQGSRNPATWVLADEPATDRRGAIQHLATLLSSLDPRRNTTLVANWTTFRSFADLPPLRSACLDIYPFFAPGDPNGPNTHSGSEQYFRAHVSRARLEIGVGTRFYVMGQAYAEIWGPQEYDRNLNLVGLPGSYVHWIQPSPAGIRWQFWESLARGAHGVFFFTATALPPIDDSFTAGPPDVGWTSALAKTRVVAGPSAILNYDLSVTPQLMAYKEEIERSQGLQDLILTLQPSVVPARVSKGVDAAGFQSSDGTRYVILVNNSLVATASVQLDLEPPYATVHDLAGYLATLSRSRNKWGARRELWTCLLPPGAGTVLRLEAR